MDVEPEGAFPSFLLRVKVEGIAASDEEVLRGKIEGGTA